MSYVLGVDGGNSKTLAAVADETGTVLGLGRAGNSNHQGQGIEPALQQVTAAVQGALSAAGIGGADLAAAYYALAGADLPEDFEVLRPALRRLGFAPRVAVDNDTVAALLAGTAASDAVVVIEGAGTNAAGRNAAGEEIRLPGLGWASGDWGGGGDLAREAFRLVCRAYDGRGEATRMESLFLHAAGLPDTGALIAALYNRRLPRAFLLSLVPLIFQAAAEGDRTAAGLLLALGDEVSVTALALLRRLHLLAMPADVVLAGGLFRAPGSILIERVRDGLQSEAPLARIVIPETDPVVGAVFGAMAEAGIVATQAVRERVIETYGRLREEKRETWTA